MSKDTKEPAWFTEYLRPCVAEFFGTLMFVFSGTMAVASEFTIAIALTHGFTYAVVIACFGTVSGGHVNPAVTLVVCAAGGIGPWRALLYVLSQVAGGITGAALCRGSLSYVPPGSAGNLTQYVLISGGAHSRPPGVPVLTALLTETAMSVFFLMTVLMATMEYKAPIHPIIIGFAAVVDVIIGLNITGASVNPVRSFGPAVIISDVKNVWADQWIYWVGPALGALIVTILFRFILGPSDKRVNWSKCVSSTKIYDVNEKIPS